MNQQIKGAVKKIIIIKNDWKFLTEVLKKKMKDKPKD